MIKNYFKVAFRNLIKYRGYSFINILGLAIGITCCLLILLYVLDELSFDKYNEKYNRIYRVAVYGLLGTNEFNGAVSSAPLAETLLREYPEVEQATRIQTFGYPVIRYKDKVFSEEKFYWADSTFFNVFTAHFIKGDPRTALTEPNTVVITESMMKKYFGNEDPVGKTINSDKRKDYEVTAVIKDFPKNSHFHFDFIGSLSSYNDDQEWLSENVYTYIVLREDVNPKEFEKKLDEVVKKYVAPKITEVIGIPFEELVSKGAKYYYYLQPLSDIHLNSNIEHEIEPNSSIIYIYIFSVIAASILAIACINFMNLTTARSSNRSKEIGIRKTLGSNRQQLIRQFLVETIIMSVIAIIISIILIELFLPSFNGLIDKNLMLNYFQNLYTLPLLVFLAVIVGIIAGIYPAFYLSSFNPIRIFRKEKIKSTKSWLRNTLVISQFSISIILFVGTIVVYTQLEYIMNKDLGYNKEQVLVIQKTDDIAAYKESFMEELRNIPGILSASNSHTIFGKELGSSAYQLSDGGERSNNLFWVINSDYFLAETYRIKMAEGRFYSKEFGTDSESIVINETAARALGLGGNAVGKEIYPVGNHGLRKKIIGVMRDFHFESLHQKIKPLVINLFNANRFGRFVSVRLASGDYKGKIESIKELWHKYAGPQAFEYFFFDEEFAKTYRSEERTGTIAAVFSALAIFIACMGLLGLAAFTTEQRTKEVGIRKILGAGVGSIVILLSKEFAKWVLIANIIAWPIAYFIMRTWLNDFAYRISIPFWSFIIAGLSALIIALLTVSYQALKAAVINPVKSLRYE
ncbi:MAG TPA: ABC transporter permease [Ignavibacteriaceae bacterium]|nr:ABC transporter permease [Ignavibacteriaceae bacterium]